MSSASVGTGSSSPSTPLGVPSPITPPNSSPSQSPNIFNNSSLLFGFLFLIILVVFVVFALTSRFVTYRRRRIAAERTTPTQPISDEPPQLLDIYIHKQSAIATTWQDVKACRFCLIYFRIMRC